MLTHVSTGSIHSPYGGVAEQLVRSDTVTIV